MIITSLSLRQLINRHLANSNRSFKSVDPNLSVNNDWLRLRTHTYWLSVVDG